MRQGLGVAATPAVAGIIVGILLQTGLGLKVPSLILELGLGNLVLTLIVSAAVLWVLGLSLPITATYLVCRLLLEKKLVHLCVPPPAAHMFVFYYAVLSEVSPPVALSPFAAAAITGGNPYRAVMLPSEYAPPCFLVPFIVPQPDRPPLPLRDTTVVDPALPALSAGPGNV